MHADRPVLSYSESVALGTVTGGLEALINLPLWTIKMRAQSDLPSTLNPRILYKGLPVAIGSMSFITSLQVLNSSALENTVGHHSSAVTYKQRITSSFVGGALSALVFGPLDLIGTQYHKHPYPNYTISVKSTIKKVGFSGLFFGVPATAITDGIFASAFYGFFTPVKREISQRFGISEKKSSVISGLVTGFAAAVISHPTDVCKTKQQYDVDVSRKSMFQLSKQMWQEKNYNAFFKGFPQRTVWLMSAVTVAGVLAENCESVIIKRR